MEKHLDEQSLVFENKRSIFYKIKTFFIKLFKGSNVYQNESKVETIKDNVILPNIRQKDDFIETLKNVEDEETKLLELQRQFDSRLIEVKDIPEEKINSLINLYKRQISELSKSNEKKKEKLLFYKNKMKNT